MGIQNHLAELVEAKVISDETAAQITDYYNSKSAHKTHPLLVAFGVLGAVLVGLGIILIVAHNWDELPRFTKSILSFLPLIIGQALVAYTLVKKRDNLAWRESSGIFLIFAIGSSISLVSQVYHIEGDFGNFLLTWCLLSLPIVYILKSGTSSLLYLIGISWYALHVGFNNFFNTEVPLFFPLLLAGIVPACMNMYQENKKSFSFYLHNWLIPISLSLVLGTFNNHNEEWLMLSFFSMYGIFYVFGKSNYLVKHSRYNGFVMIGALGMLVILYILSYEFYWNHLLGVTTHIRSSFMSMEFWFAIALSSCAVFISARYAARNFHRSKDYLALFPLIIPVVFSLAIVFEFPVMWLISLLILALGVGLIKEGANSNSLWLLNFGLSVASILIICRFFDTNMTFLIRGTLFLLVGASFFIANYLTLKKLNSHEE